MKTTQEDFYKFLKSSLFSKAETEEELGYKDPFVTKEQKKRDEHITRLLDKYVSFYESKVEHSKICRYIILIPCVAIILAFSVLLIFLSLKVLNVDSELDIQDVVAFITACISFISLIIGLLTIITKYFFLKTMNSILPQSLNPFKKMIWRTNARMPDIKKINKFHHLIMITNRFYYAKIKSAGRRGIQPPRPALCYARITRS